MTHLWRRAVESPKVRPVSTAPGGRSVGSHGHWETSMKTGPFLPLLRAGASTDAQRRENACRGWCFWDDARSHFHQLVTKSQN
jgi:hypothetical protein